MFQMSDPDCIDNGPAGEPDAWDDVLPRLPELRPPEPRVPEPRPATFPERTVRDASAQDRSATDTTVEEFRSLARAIEERRNVLRSRAPAPSGSAAPAQGGPRTSRSSAATSTRGVAASRFAQVHARQEARAAQPAPSRPFANQAARPQAHATDLALDTEVGAAKAWIKTLRESIQPSVPSTAAGALDLEHMRAVLCDLERRIQALEQARTHRRERTIAQAPQQRPQAGVSSAQAPRRLWA